MGDQTRVIDTKWPKGRILEDVGSRPHLDNGDHNPHTLIEVLWFLVT